MSKQPAQQLYTQIKLDIRSNQLPIGEPLKQVELSELYGVSRIPIRDVLQRLKSEGWLASCGKRGVMVPPLCAKEAEDLYLMRMQLEPLLIGYAIPLVNQQTLGKAQDFLTVLDTNRQLTVEQSGELNWQFHATLYEAANRNTMFNIVASLHQQCGRYIGYHSQKLKYAQTSQDEHYLLLEAVKKSDVVLARQVLEQHIGVAGKILVSFLSQQK